MCVCMCGGVDPPVSVRSFPRMHVKVKLSKFPTGALDLLLGGQTADSMETMDARRAFLCKQGGAATFSTRTIGKHVIPP